MFTLIRASSKQGSEPPRSPATVKVSCTTKENPGNGLWPRSKRPPMSSGGCRSPVRGSLSGRSTVVERPSVSTEGLQGVGDPCDDVAGSDHLRGKVDAAVEQRGLRPSDQPHAVRSASPPRIFSVLTGEATGRPRGSVQRRRPSSSDWKASLRACSSVLVASCGDLPYGDCKSRLKTQTCRRADGVGMALRIVIAAIAPSPDESTNEPTARVHRSYRSEAHDRATRPSSCGYRCSDVPSPVRRSVTIGVREGPNRLLG